MPPKKKLKKENAGKATEMESVKVELWREALNALRGKDGPIGSVGKELHSFGQMVEGTLTRCNNRQRAIGKKRINDVLFEVEMEKGDPMSMGGSLDISIHSTLQHLRSPRCQ